MSAVDRSVIRDMKTGEDIVRYLTAENLTAFKSSEVDHVYAALQRCVKEPGCVVAYGGNYTLEPLNRYVNAYAARFGVLCGE